MQIVITWQTFITAAAFVGAVIALVTYFSKVVRWVDKQAAQDKEIKAIKEEQVLLVHGILACLKGLQEKGCNGPVTEAINRYEEYLNQKAHK
jgi:hypothetical protein